MTSPLDAMQAAVDIVLTSPHPDNKVSASLFKDGRIVARTNTWPPAILSTIGNDTRIGNSSGTIHAEVQCVSDAPFTTEGASLCVTDPFCPNCAKNIAEAGIKSVYIDHKGFEKDFAQRRGLEFESMSLRIAARAGISIYEARRKEGVIVPLLEIPSSYIAPQDNPIKVDAVTIQDLGALVSSVKVIAERWACGYALNNKGELFSLIASVHAAIGYSEHSPADREKLSRHEGKYNFFIEPMNRLMMGAARYGLKLISGQIYASCIPTSRELVNMAGAGLTDLHVGSVHCRDEDGPRAAEQLAQHGILFLHTAKSNFP